MANPTDLAKLVPGFDFLQNLMKGAGAGLPSMGQWIAPTLNPEELDKRIQELKTVQFWLENNAKLLATTIQALEVQRMTLSTLQTMNLPMADLRDALKIKPPAAAPAAPAAPTMPPPAPRKKPAARKPAAKADSAKSAPPAVDPMQWWGALTQQFTELATKAMRDSAADAALNLAGNLAGAAVKQAAASTASTLKKAATLPARAVSPRRRS
jgi:hypothetical protein